MLPRELLVWSALGVLLLASSTTAANCSKAPDADTFHTCTMLYKMDDEARVFIRKRQTFENSIGAPGVGGVSPAVPPRFAPSAQGCMNIACICPYMGGRVQNGGCILPNGQPYRMALRKEYRMMSDNERQRWNNAIIQLKRSGEYDRLSVMHRQVGSNSGAHSGPGFLVWHREYMKRVEIALRMLDPGIALPYWDSVLDSYLPDPRDSIMFSAPFMGETDRAGQVVRGSFAGFRTLEGRPNIVRNMAREGKLFSEANINNLLSQTEIHNVLAYTAPQAGCPFQPNFGAIEYTHSSIHLWLGGDMKPPSTSANDPIFFLHHTFVDFIWELWRNNRQNRRAREQMYAPDIQSCANPQHFSYAQMRPWDKQNKDGLSNEYTDNLYHYAPRPTCSHGNPSCGSPYLFCDTRGAPHCVAKVRQNGQCRGFEGFDSCWQGLCLSGWCRPGRFQQVTTTAVTIRRAPQATTARPQAAPTQPTQNQDALSANNCYNDDPCCEAWARSGECRTNTAYMNRYCKRSCALCRTSAERSGCHDRHVSCAFWRTQNYCSRRRQWMSENCQASCGWCGMSKAQLCSSVARMSRA